MEYNVKEGGLQQDSICNESNYSQGVFSIRKRQQVAGNSGAKFSSTSDEQD